jgi:hypothetical protein
VTIRSVMRPHYRGLRIRRLGAARVAAVVVIAAIAQAVAPSWSTAAASPPINALFVDAWSGVTKYQLPVNITGTVDARYRSSEVSYEVVFDAYVDGRSGASLEFHT